ncbi:unnamed protein product [Eruca vesicaria subsp. sativa]|uniref:WIYLD domain-containing protein n=1 Tax=Eruca vesicaria subsp. sativa TaxID=29727 RepID=A0ABC8LMU0_ERUVS|nr:unnamed protein product [Eruca vesicaria subsp. sativa]
MAPKGRKRKAGMMREDAARDAMRAYGFAERLINRCIKELLQVYGQEGWFLIEESGYLVLLNKCLEQSEEQNKKMAEEDEQEEEMAEDEQQDHEIAEAEQEQTPLQEEEQEQEQEHEKQVEEGRDHVGSNSTSLVGCVPEAGTQTCQTEALSTTSQTEILDSSPAGEASVIDFASPVAFPSGGFAQHSAAGAKSSGRGGWISDEDDDEDPDPDADSDGDDDEIIQLTPEPLCEELEELVKKLRGEEKRKKTRWGN